MINARTNARLAREQGGREESTASPRGVTDNVIREKGKARGAYHLAEVSVTCLMDSAERVITVGRRYGRHRAFFPRRASSRSGLGPGRFIHSCEKHACGAGPLQPARTRAVRTYVRTQVGLNPASRSLGHGCGAVDA